MNNIIKVLFVVAVINLLIYIFYSIAFLFYLPNFGLFGIMAILIGIIAFFSAKGFYKLINVSGIERIKSIVTVHTVILVIISALTMFLTPLLKETIANIEQVSKYKKFKAGQAPIENGVWKYRKAGLLQERNELLVSCKDGQIDGKVIFNGFDEEAFRVDFYTKGQLDSTTFWEKNHEIDTMYLTKTRIKTDTFFYDLDFKNIEKEVQKIGINEKGDTILNIKSPVVLEVFDID